MSSVSVTANLNEGGAAERAEPASQRTNRPFHGEGTKAVVPLVRPLAL